MKKKIYLWVSIIAIAILILYLLGIIGTEKIAPGTTTTPIVHVNGNTQTITVKQTTIKDVFSWPGTVKSRTEAHIAPRITARILEIKVNVGDKVHKGDVIARLDPETQRTQKEAAYANLVAAKANLERAKADARRIQNLFKKDAATKQMYDQVMSQYQVAKANVKAAASRLQQTRVGFDDTILKAPFDGVIVQRLKEPGDMGAAGIPVVTMHNSAVLRLEVPVPVSCGRHIHIGDKDPVRIENLEQNMTAEIDEIEPEVDPATRTILIKAILPESKGLQPGLFGWLDQACSEHQGLLVPTTAVRKIGQLEIIKIVKGDQITTRQVRTGKQYGFNIEILSGLNEGETVVIN